MVALALMCFSVIITSQSSSISTPKLTSSASQRFSPCCKRKFPAPCSMQLIQSIYAQYHRLCIPQLQHAFLNHHTLPPINICTRFMALCFCQLQKQHFWQCCHTRDLTRLCIIVNQQFDAGHAPTANATTTQSRILLSNSSQGTLGAADHALNGTWRKCGGLRRHLDRIEFLADFPDFVTTRVH